MSGKLTQHWSLRAATGADASAAIDLWTKAYVTEGEGGRTEPYTERDFADVVGSGTVFIADRAGAVVGVVALSPPGTPGHAVAGDGEAELSRLAVAAPARCSGIGRALVMRCEDMARAEGWSAIALWSRAYQSAAHRLYESLGYRRVPERDTTDETGHARLVFRLDLGALPE